MAEELLSAFVEARLKEAQRAEHKRINSAMRKAVAGGKIEPGQTITWDSPTIQDIETKRAILRRCEETAAVTDKDMTGWALADDVIELLASTWKTHSEYPAA